MRILVLFGMMTLLMSSVNAQTTFASDETKLDSLIDETFDAKQKYFNYEIYLNKHYGISVATAIGDSKFKSGEFHYFDKEKKRLYFHRSCPIRKRIQIIEKFDRRLNTKRAVYII